MRSRTGGTLTCFAVPALIIVAVVLWERSVPAPFGAHLVPLLAAVPAVTCAGTGRRRGAVIGGVCALLVLYPLLGSVSAYAGPGSRAGTCAAILAVVLAGYGAAGRRLRLKRELVRTREVAAAAQAALIRPLPSRVEGLAVAAGHLSATRGAEVGGDLYDVAATPYGVRAVIGDVRGHGLPAVGTVAAVLGCFREAAHDEPRLDRLLRRLDRALERHMRERQGEPDEDFVTVLLLEIRADGTASALSCGHPWPYRLTAPHEGAACAEPVAEVAPLPPLGLFPLPARTPARRLALPPGEAFLLFTDGAEDARDADGGCFPLADALRDAACQGPAELVASVTEGLLRHGGERLGDDVALLVLRNDRRVPEQSPAPVRERAAHS